MTYGYLTIYNKKVTIILISGFIPSALILHLAPAFYFIVRTSHVGPEKT